MDSTLINIECVDEVADAAGRKAEVSAITEAAMRGEITDYKDSLRRRVALLKGVPEGALSEVYQQRLRLNPGAAELVQACKVAGLKVLLVSGGFTYFTDSVRDTLGIDFTRSNVFEIENGLLTGRMVDQPWGDICDGEEKRRMVLQTCAQLGITPGQAIAMGDGANDLPMMKACADPEACRWLTTPSRKCVSRPWCRSSQVASTACWKSSRADPSPRHRGRSAAICLGHEIAVAPKGPRNDGLRVGQPQAKVSWTFID